MEKDRRSYRILVVEDNPGDYALIEDYLRELIASPSLHRARSFSEASSFLQKEDRPDIILLDLSLPDRSDEDLILSMLDLAANIPVIILTGYADVQFGVRSLSLGVSDYLLKDELSASMLYKSLLYNIERRKTVAELEASEKRYSDLFHLSPQPMMVYDPKSLRFLDVNQAAIDHYGYTRDEFLAMDIMQIRPAEDVPLLEQVIEESRRSQSTFYRGNFRHLKKNGDLIHVDVQRNTLFYKGRKAHVVVCNDITQSLRYIEAIEKQNSDLHEIAWMQSHLVRAPLARIMGFAALIKDNFLSEEEKSFSLQNLLKAAEEFDIIIKDIVKKAEQVTQSRR